MKYTYHSFFLLYVILQSCSPKVQSNSAEVNFLYREALGTIAMKSMGYGQNQNEAIADAQKNAFSVILFRGLPGTELNIPLIENENDAKSRYSDYFEKFFNENRYKTFMMSSTVSSNLIKLKGIKKISVDVKINYNSLRKDLEQNRLVRKFGY
jgi:hypothetical protein